MRRLNGWLQAGLGMAIGTCLVAGCIPAPNRAKLPGPGGQEGVVRSALPPSLGGAIHVARRVPGMPTVVASPLQAPSVISNNGGNVLKGSVRAPATIISHNGGNIVSNNGGGIVSNNGGGIISHNGGNLQIVQLPMAFTTVRVKDAAGQPVRDDQGRELVAKTDANGNYSFPVEVKGRNLVIEADVDGQSGRLKSLLPKEGIKVGGTLDVDMASTLTLAYILDQYVKGDLNTFERLPREIEAKARLVTEEAIVVKQIALPTTLDNVAIVAKVDEVRSAAPEVDQVFEEIKRLLVIAGIVNEGDGLKGVEVNAGVVGGSTLDREGNVYVFSQSLHTLWKLTPDGILHTLVPKGGWGYPEESISVYTPGYTSGLVCLSDGTLILADTYHNRIVSVSPAKQVTVIAGTGASGFSGDGNDAKNAQFNRPSGLVRDADGNLFVSDTENHRVRKIEPGGRVQSIIGDGTSGYTGDGGSGTLARVNRPQGLAIDESGKLYVADYENARIRVWLRDRIETYGPQAESIHSPIALVIDPDVGLLCLGHLTGSVTRVSSSQVSSVYDATNVSRRGLEPISFPRSFAVGNDKWLVDNGMQFFGRLESDGAFSRLIGVTRQDQKANVQFVSAYKMVVDDNENIVVADMGAKKIFKILPDGAMQVLLGDGSNAKELSSNTPLESGVGMVAAVTIGNDGNLLFSSIGGFTTVKRYDFGNSVSTIVGTGKVNYVTPPLGDALKVDLANVYDIAQLPDGTIVFSMAEQNFLMALGTNGVVTHFIDPRKLGGADNLEVDRHGKLVFVEENKGVITMVEGGVTRTLLNQSDLDGLIDIGQIRGVAFDANNDLYIASKTRVVKWNSEKKVTPVAGTTAPYLNGTTRDDGLVDITDLAISPIGNLYILESQQLKRLTASQLGRL